MESNSDARRAQMNAPFLLCHAASQRTLHTLLKEDVHDISRVGSGAMRTLRVHDPAIRERTRCCEREHSTHGHPQVWNWSLLRFQFEKHISGALAARKRLLSETNMKQNYKNM